MKPTLADTFAVRARNDHGPRKTGFLALAGALLTGKACGIILPLVLYIPLSIAGALVGRFCAALGASPAHGLVVAVSWLPLPIEMWIIGRLLRRDVALGVMNLLLGVPITMAGMFFTMILMYGRFGPS